MFDSDLKKQIVSNKRINVTYGLIIVLFSIFLLRLFYIQVIQYSNYKAAALDDQLKQYDIPARRGQINIMDGSSVVPLVLNQTLYTVYADPTFIKNSSDVSSKIAPILNKNQADINDLLQTKNTRYVVLAKKVSADQNKSLLDLKIPGVGSTAQSYRIYPQGSLASQLLGFVDDNGVGQYGIEQALNPQLNGKDGKFKAVTDINGVPLASSSSNVLSPPQNGDTVNLSIDLGMQSQMEQILANEYKKTNSKGISAIIMDPYNGQIKAMANFPTYDPTNIQNTDPSLFQNAAVANAIEPGSTMKLLTAASALDQGIVTPDTTYYDPAQWNVDGSIIKNVEVDGGARQQSVATILSLSLNTGAVWLLMQMGGGQLSDKSITAWHDYLVKHYHFGQYTNIEQGYESTGYIPAENFSDSSIMLTYATTSFGQSLTVTDLQMADAVSSLVNGGTIYQPTLVDSLKDSNGNVTKNKPKIIQKNAVSKKVSDEMIPLMENITKTAALSYSFVNFSSDYSVGGKTGTAQVSENGSYLSNIYNGTYMGFVGGDKPQYVIAIFNIKPVVPGFAGPLGGMPVFADLAHMLINEGYVQPKTK